MSTRNAQKRSLPFLKWAGGKRWFAQRHIDIFPERFNRYFEPFLGSGAIFFALRPDRATLGDINSALIDTYRAIQSDWRGVVKILKKHARRHSSQYYYSLRASEPRTASARAARFIYLNRTCWNGLYRVNSDGRFNVPIGTKKQVLLPTDDFRGVHGQLKNTDLISGDFSDVIRGARARDLVFVDPPYTVKHNQNGFIKYNERLFGWADQIRLRDCLIDAKRRGAYVIVTNAHSPSVIALYAQEFKRRCLQRRSVIAANSSNRGMTTELVFTSY